MSCRWLENVRWRTFFEHIEGLNCFEELCHRVGRNLMNGVVAKMMNRQA